MKRTTLFKISLVYGLVLVLLSVMNLALFIMEPAFSPLFMMFYAGIISILMLIGAFSIRSHKNYGRYFLMIAGVLAAPLGLIVTMFAVGLKPTD